MLELSPEALEKLDPLFLIVSVVMGGMIGSFLNVCIYRWPAGLSVVKPGSRCPKCETPITWRDNIPVLSWMILGAKCRHCKNPISWRYPLVEAITAALFLGVYLKYGFSIASPVYMILAASLVVVTFVDLDDMTIPNEITMPGIPIGLALSVFAMMVEGTELLLDNPIMSIAGVFLGGGILYALDILSMVVFKKRGMGFGDVKLLAMLGAFFGVKGVVLIIFLSAFFGSVIGIAAIAISRQQKVITDDDGKENVGHYLPFGPFIVLGGLIYMFVGPQIVDMYLEYMKVPGAI
jgi:leader peptidase (prepilin peptidase)/N-methyltransferase